MWVSIGAKRIPSFVPDRNYANQVGAFGAFKSFLHAAARRRRDSAWESIVFVSQQENIPGRIISAALPVTSIQATRIRVRAKGANYFLRVACLWSWTKLIKASLSWLTEKATSDALLCLQKKRLCSQFASIQEKKLAQHEAFSMRRRHTTSGTADFYYIGERRYQHYQTRTAFDF